MFCSNCGAKLEDSAKFCSSCGNHATVAQKDEPQPELYNLILTGELVDGFDLSNVKENLQKSLKLSPVKLDKVFSKKDVIIKKEVDKETAEKFIRVFEKAGAICSIVPIEEIERNQVKPEKEGTYDVFITGDTLEGFTKSQVESNLVKSFNLKGSQLGEIFSSRGLRIKEDINKEAAEKLKIVIETCGAVCQLRRVSATSEPSVPQPTDNKIESTNEKAGLASNESKPLEAESEKPKLWNPNAAASWSILFTPVFGAYLHAKNWLALGDEEASRRSMNWVYGGIATVLLSFFIPFLGLIYLLTWYFASAKRQVKFITEQYGDIYRRKSWGKPLGIAFPIYIILVVIAISVSSYEDYKSDIKIKEEASETTGNKPNKIATPEPSYSKGRIIENGLVCFVSPEKVGEYLYRLEKYNIFKSDFCRFNDGGREIPVYIIKNSRVNGEDVSEVKVNMDKDSFWTLTSNIRSN